VKPFTRASETKEAKLKKICGQGLARNNNKIVHFPVLIAIMKLMIRCFRFHSIAFPTVMEGLSRAECIWPLDLVSQRGGKKSVRPFGGVRVVLRPFCVQEQS
jgi:hypothetical protein